MLDNRREDQDGQRQEQTDPEALLKFRDHETVIMARMIRAIVMCLMATVNTRGVHIVHGMTVDARVVRTVVVSIAMLSGGHSYAPRPSILDLVCTHNGHVSLSYDVRIVVIRPLSLVWFGQMCR